MSEKKQLKKVVERKIEKFEKRFEIRNP